jgi:hypothetical protein
MFKVTDTRISNMADIKALFHLQSEIPYSDASGLGTVQDKTVAYNASSHTPPREHSTHTNVPYTPTQFNTKQAQGNHYYLPNASVYNLEQRTGF